MIVKNFFGRCLRIWTEFFLFKRQILLPFELDIHKILVGSCGVKPSVSISSNNEGSVTTHYHGLRSRIYFPINYWKQIKIGASEEFCHPIIGLEIRSPTFERHLQYMAEHRRIELLSKVRQTFILTIKLMFQNWYDQRALPPCFMRERHVN